MIRDSKIGAFAKAFTFTFSLASAFLLIDGLYEGQWWAGFGLVLLLTSLIVAVGFHGSSSSSMIKPEVEQK